MEKAAIKSFLLSALIVGYRILVGDERLPFGLSSGMPLWLGHVIAFAALFILLLLDFWLLDLWEKHREKKKMEKYIDGQS